MQKCDAVDAESDGTVPKNARCCTGREVDTNRNVKHYFSLLQKKLIVNGWRILQCLRGVIKHGLLQLYYNYLLLKIGFDITSVAQVVKYVAL